MEIAKVGLQGLKREKIAEARLSRERLERPFNSNRFAGLWQPCGSDNPQLQDWGKIVGKKRDELRPSSPKEQFLARLVMSEVGYCDKVRLADGFILMNRAESASEHATCLALASCGLNGSASLREDFHRWFDQQTSLLPLAAVFEMATYSRQRAGLVQEQIINRHRLALTGEVQQLWFSIWGGEQPTFSEIVRGVGYTGKWKQFPSDGQLVQMLTHVAEPTPDEDFANMAGRIIRTGQLAKMPYLCQQIAREIVYRSCSNMIKTVDTGDFDLLLDDLIELLTLPEPFTGLPRLGRGNSYAGHLSYIKAIDLLVQRMADMEEVRRRTVATKMLAEPQPCWIDPHMVTLSRWADPGSELLPQLWQHKFRFRLEGEEYRTVYGGDERRVLARRTYACPNVELARLINPPEGEGPISEPALIAIIKRLSGDKETDSRAFHVSNKDVVDQLCRRMALHSDEWRSAFAELVKTGQVHLNFLMVYLRVFRLKLNDGQSAWEKDEKTLAEWQGWLDSYDFADADHRSEDQLIAEVVSWRLKAGQLLSDDRCFKKIQALGYQLCPEDLSDQRVVWNILGISRDHRGDIKFSDSASWRIEQWRKVILDSDINPDWIIASALSSAAGQSTWSPKSHLGLLEEWLGLACEEKPALQKAVCRQAWGEGRACSGSANAMLAVPGRMERWAGPEERQLLGDSYSRFRLLSEGPELALRLLGLAEARNIFFGFAFGKDVQSDLPSLQKWGPVFIPTAAEEGQPKILGQLKKWLMVHQHQINPWSWMEWVDSFGFISDPAVFRQVFDYRSSDKGSTADLANQIWLRERGPFNP